MKTLLSNLLLSYTVDFLAIELRSHTKQRLTRFICGTRAVFATASIEIKLDHVLLSSRIIILKATGLMLEQQTRG